jgi:alpha(1,3/1,4) fucosyltransferase
MHICFFPHSIEFSNNALFENAPMSEFRKQLMSYGIECDTDDCCNPEKSEVLAFHRLDLVIGRIHKTIRNNEKCKLFLFSFEEPVICGLHEEGVLPFLDLDRVFCWRDDFLDYKNIIKANIPQAFLSIKNDGVSFSDRKLIVAIDGNKKSRHPNEAYSLRRDTLKGLYYSGIKVDMFGRGWEKSCDKILKSIWKGEINDKISIQNQYKFTLCIQNSKGYPGDICEKIFDAFDAKSIPIYHGAPNIGVHIPKECFIDLREFKNTVELAKFIINFSEEEYVAMMAHVQNYFSSTDISKFSGGALADIVAGELLDIEKNIGFRRSRDSIIWTFGISLNLIKSLRYVPRITKLRSLRCILKSLFIK